MSTPKIETIAERWKDFAKQVLHVSVVPGTPQYEDMQQSFYAGALCTFMYVERLGKPDVSEDDGEVFLNRLESELTEFWHNVQRRDAERN